MCQTRFPSRLHLTTLTSPPVTQILDEVNVRGVFVASVLFAIGCQASDHLSTIDQAVVTISPPSYAFASLQVGQTSAPVTISVLPGIGANDDTVTSVTYSCPDFSVTATGLPAEVVRTCEVTGCGDDDAVGVVMCPVACITDEYLTYSFTATFHPTVAAALSCVVSINGTSPETITLTGTGTPPPVHLTVEPTSIAFGDVRTATASSSAALSVGNTGGSTMTVSSVSISTGFAIVSGPTTSYTVASNASQAYELSCDPTALGAISGSFVVNSNDPVTPTTSVPLTCTGINSVLDVTPSPATLATTRVGEPVQMTIQIGNSGNVSTTLQSVAVTGDMMLMSGPAANTVLAASGSTPVVVTYSAAAAGDASGTLVITYDGNQTRTTQLTGRALATSLSLDPDGDVAFGPVCVGQTASQMFTLVANSDGAFSLQQITADSGPYTIMAPTLPATLQGNAANNATFHAIAAPTDVGDATGTLTLTTDIPDAMPHIVNLDVIGIQAGVSATPASLDFGSNPINTTTIGQQAQLSNCLTTPITASNPRIEGDNATEFAIVADPQSATISASGLASWLIVFQGRTVGLKTATFSVDYDGGTASVDLTAETLGDTGSGGGSTLPSYYSCSTGSGPIGLTPVAFVLLALRRRRRPVA